MLPPIEITPHNLRSLFDCENIPLNTSIIIHASEKRFIIGKVVDSRVFSKLHKMVIKIDKTTELFTYPSNRFFLPSIAVSRKIISTKVAVSVMPPVVCQS